MKIFYFKKTLVLIFIIFLYLIVSRHIISFLFEDTKGYVHFITEITIKIPLIIFTIVLIKRESSINIKYLFRNNIICAVLSIVLLYFSIQTTISKINHLNLEISLLDLYAYLFQCLSTGFFEELFFRTLIFVYICKYVNQTKPKNHYKQAIITSALFAIVHLSGIFKGFDIISIFNQILFAFSIGLLFQSVFFRVNNIIIISIIHALFNFHGMLKQKLFNISSINNEVSTIEDFKETLITFFVLNLFMILPLMYFSLRKRNNFLLKTVDNL